jgi:hypothetical protein
MNHQPWSISYIVIDQKPLTGGVAPLAKVKLYWSDRLPTNNSIDDRAVSAVRAFPGPWIWRGMTVAYRA